MQAKIVYAVIFLMAFIFTSGALYILSSNYTNVFKFDFTPVKGPVVKTKVIRLPGTKVDVKEIKNYLRNQFQKEIHDSISALRKVKAGDTMYKSLQREIDSLKRLNRRLDNTQKLLESKEKELKILKDMQVAQQDSAYVKWKKEMIKIYEQMDPKSAAKIIQNLPENLAKDIVISMKSKKSAKILAEMNQEFAARISSSRSK